MRGILAVTPRDVLRTAAEAFSGPERQAVVMAAFDAVEQYRHVPGMSEAYRKLLAAIADLAGELETYGLKLQWGVEEPEIALRVPKK